MRFQKGIGYPYPRPPRGRGRGDPPYRMSRAAYQARLQNLVGVERKRTHAETRRIELEIALGTHRGETYRAMAKRLGCSHPYCWRVARRYRAGLIPVLPRDEQELVALRDSLDHDPATERHAAAAVPAQFLKVPWAWTRQWRSQDEIWASMLLTQEQKTMLAAESDRRAAPPAMSDEERQRQLRDADTAAALERLRHRLEQERKAAAARLRWAARND